MVNSDFTGFPRGDFFGYQVDINSKLSFKSCRSQLPFRVSFAELSQLSHSVTVSEDAPKTFNTLHLAVQNFTGFPRGDFFGYQITKLSFKSCKSWLPFRVYFHLEFRLQNCHNCHTVSPYRRMHCQYIASNRTKAELLQSSSC